MHISADVFGGRKSLEKPVTRQKTCNYIELFGSSTRDRMHDNAYIGGRSENNINASCITISGGRTKQLDIFCHVTDCTSDFLSFVVVELTRFFHRAIQLAQKYMAASPYTATVNDNLTYPNPNPWVAVNSSHGQLVTVNFL